MMKSMGPSDTASTAVKIPLKWTTLRFSQPGEPDLEPLFRDHFFLTNLNHLRYCHGFTILFYVMAGIIDYLLFPDDWKTLFAIRFLVVVPVFIIGFFYTYSRHYQRFWQQISFFYILITGWSFIIFTMIARPPAAYGYYVGILFCMMFGYTLIRERFIYASLAGLILVAGYLFFSACIVRMPPHDLFHSNFYLFLANALGMLIARHLEISARRDFYLEHKLIIEQEKVVSLNTRLEQKVDERTHALHKEIAERKQAEAVLAESGRRYRELFQNNPACCFTFDRQGVIQDWNRASEALYGWNAQQAIGRSMFDLMVQKKNRSRTEQNIAALFDGDALEGVEFQDRKADGSLCDLLVSEYPIFDSSGKVEYGLCAELDITDYKRAAEALRESEKKYRKFLEASPDPIIVYDVNGRVVYFNNAFTRVFGWTLDERIGKPMDLFVPPDAWRETQQMIRKISAAKDFSGLESRRLTKDGRTLDVTISAAINKDPAGNPIGTVVNIRDISEHRRLEARLQRAQKMEALGVLAGGVAHDINNVLSGIVSYPDLLLLELPEDSPLRKPILTIQESGKKAADIVQDLLTLARRGVVVEDVVNLNAIVSDYLNDPEHEKLLSFHPAVTVKSDLAMDLLNVKGSRVHLAKTLMNLVSNAAEAMPDGGSISIATENRYVDAPINGYDHLAEGDYVVLKIADSGIGIAPDERERIFEPFYTKKVMGRSGTGLGMAVVWGTVKDHNGYIDVQSAKGRGTTFTLYFPASRHQAKGQRHAWPIEAYRGRGELILVVDDVEAQREIAVSLLKRLGYAVQAVASGEQAVDYVADNRVDLVMIDMIMDPGMDGLDTYRRIVEKKPGQKAIIASGFSETSRVRAAQQLGAGEYVKKPYTLEKIGIAIRTELDR
jgi:PAS domain S-box-containing protein